MILRPTLPAYGGYTIAREEKVILIKGAVPGELVDVNIDERKRDYMLATVTQVIEPSEFRVEPNCPVFGICGGCHLQFIAYEKQVGMKEEVLVDSLTRLGGIEVQLSPSLTGEQWHYRHRAQFKVSREGTIGFFRESSRDVVVFDSCPLMIGRINELLQRIRENNLASGLKEIHLSVGDSAAVLLKGDLADVERTEAFREAGIASIAVNNSLIEGSGTVAFDLNGLNYTLSPWTFFQAHWSLNLKVAEYITGLTAPLEVKKVLDLYAGAGNFSLPLSRYAEEVVLVEENPFAVEDGTRNLKLNALKNCKFVKSSAEKYRIQKKFDLIILDPPRPGLTSEVVKKILETPADTIVYISCNPSTLARDLKKLKVAYEIQSVQMIDFFPNTFHIEAAAFLRRK
ncbi:MAG: class I SAM-dependent RNA methyltransferase [Nitrospirae bacterium]|nr:class I SAM-dependent RNA methyltransferase [Nitrospirota bacterium]